MEHKLFSNKRVGLLFILLSIFLNSCSTKNKSSISNLCETLRISCIRGMQKIEIYTNKGNMTFQLDGNSSPITVSNFLELINKGFYEKKSFYKVIRDPYPFVIQSGAYDFEKVINKGNYSSEIIIGNNKQERLSIPLEIKLKDEELPRYGSKIVDTKLLDKIQLKHKKGSISMAREQSLNSASTDFFISLNLLPILDGRYAVFGNLVKGINVLELINEGDYIEKIVHLND